MTSANDDDSEAEIGDIQFGFEVTWGVVARVASFLGGMVGSIVLARVLGPAGYGLFYFANAIAKIVDNPVSGWAVACKKRLTEQDYDEQEVLGALLIANSVFILLVSPFLYVLIGLVTESVFLKSIIPALVVSNILFGSLSTLLSGRANFSKSMWATTVQSLTVTTFQIAFVLLGTGVWGMAGGSILGSLLVVPLLLRWLKISPVLPSGSTVGGIGSFARWSIPTSFLGSALYRIDLLLLGWLAGSSSVGLYQVSWKLLIPALFVNEVATSGLLGRISNLESRDKNWEEDFSRVISFTSLTAVPLLFGAAVVGSPLIRIVYGQAYLGATPFLIGLALHHFLRTQTSARTSVMQGLDVPEYSLYINITMIFINTVGGILLFWWLGPIGIVVSAVLAQGFELVASIYATRRMTTDIPIVTRPFLVQVGSGAAMSLVLVTAKMVVPTVGIVELIALLLLGGVTYGTITMALSAEIRNGITDIVSRIDKG